MVTPVDWPKDSQRYDIYISGEGMYELLFSSQQPKAKGYRKHCCIMLFSHVRQQRANKMEEDHQQAIIKMQKEHQAAVINHDNQLHVFQCENVGCQGEIRNARQTVTELIENKHVP